MTIKVHMACSSVNNRLHAAFIAGTAPAVNNACMEPIERTKQVLDELGWSWAKLARELDTNDQRLYNWRQRGLPEGEAHRVAKALGVSTDWLLTGEGPKRFSGKMDASLASIEPKVDANVSDGPEIKGKVPLISWVQAGSAQEAIDLFQPGVADEWVPTSAPIREHTYALRIEGDSMSPKFQPGMQIIVEPDMPYENGSYVIAKNQEGETTFKRLVKDAGVWLLKPENSQYPTLRLDDGYNIIGVVRRAEIVLC